MRPDIEEALQRAKDMGCSTLSITKQLETLSGMLLPGERVWLACRSGVHMTKKKPGQVRLTPGNRFKVSGLFFLTDFRLLHLGSMLGSEELHQIRIDQITGLHVRWGFSTSLVAETPLLDMEITFTEKTARAVLAAIENLQKALKNWQEQGGQIPEAETVGEQAADLERLYVLLQRGILTQEEYEEKKARLLGGK